MQQNEGGAVKSELHSWGTHRHLPKTQTVTNTGKITLGRPWQTRSCQPTVFTLLIAVWQDSTGLWLEETSFHVGCAKYDWRVSPSLRRQHKRPFRLRVHLVKNKNIIHLLGYMLDLLNSMVPLIYWLHGKNAINVPVLSSYKRKYVTHTIHFQCILADK